MLRSQDVLRIQHSVTPQAIKTANGQKVFVVADYNNLFSLSPCSGSACMKRIGILIIFRNLEKEMYLFSKEELNTKLNSQFFA